jgi:hypothetical protein
MDHLRNKLSSRSVAELIGILEDKIKQGEEKNESLRRLVNAAEIKEQQALDKLKVWKALTTD